jgi:hypothetical protein
MELSERIAPVIARLPAQLKQLLDMELAAGNKIIDMEIGRGEAAGRTVLVLTHPFRTRHLSAPPGVLYRELLNREPKVYEFYTQDESISLMTAVFKPMVLQPLAAPEDRNEAHIKRMEEIHKRDAEVAAARAEAMCHPPKPAPDPTKSDIINRFLQSMVITYEMWHDGNGYDVDLLKQMAPEEREAVEKTLITHQPRDWRDIEALAMIDSAMSRSVIESALKSTDPSVRREAMKYAGEKADPADREKLIIHAIRTKAIFDGLSQTLDEIEEFHTPAIVDALFRGALDGDGEAAVHFTAMLFFLHGKSREAFDWDHRPFFLRFNTTDRNERRNAFKELCQTVGVDSEKYMR